MLQSRCWPVCHWRASCTYLRYRTHNRAFSAEVLRSVRNLLFMTARFPLQPQPLSAVIADRLRHRILEGAWSPGADINEAEIATQLGVSRTPVREALKLLCQEGLLTAQARRGMRIATLSAAQIEEAQQLHTLLHTHMVQHPTVQDGLAQQMLSLAAQRLKLADLQRIPQL